MLCISGEAAVKFEIDHSQVGSFPFLLLVLSFRANETSFWPLQTASVICNVNTSHGSYVFSLFSFNIYSLGPFEPEVSNAGFPLRTRFVLSGCSLVVTEFKMRIVSAAGREAEFEIAGAGVANQRSELSIDGRMSLRFSDVSLLFLNIIFVSLVCLRRECRNCKTIVLFNLILSDWLAVLYGTFSEQALQTHSFPPLLSVLQEPTALLHTGNSARLLFNTEQNDFVDSRGGSHSFWGKTLSAVCSVQSFQIQINRLEAHFQVTRLRSFYFIRPMSKNSRE